MKIGAFAKQNQVTVDTIRHYIKMELLIPQKSDKQYEFDRQCQQDFDDILLLKGLGFTLQEIKDLFVVRHLGKMTPFEHDEYYKNRFREKAQRITSEIERLGGEKSRLEAELRKLDTENEREPSKTGIRLEWLNYLACDRCGSPLVLHQASVEENMVMSGKLRCGCGNEYRVRDGILFAVGCPESDDPPLDIVSYIQNTDTEYLNRIYKTLEWNARQLHPEKLAGKVLLEPGSETNHKGSTCHIEHLIHSLLKAATFKSFFCFHRLTLYFFHLLFSGFSKPAMRPTDLFST